MEAPPVHALRTVHLTALPNESQIDLLAISVIKAKCDTTKKALNKLLLEMEHVKPIVDDPDQARKRLLLKRDLPLKAVGTRSSHYLFVTARAESEALQPPALQQILKSEPSARLVVHSLPISVDNISYGQFLTVFRNLTRSEDILRSLLPDDIEIPTSYEIVGHIAHLNLRPAQLPYQHLIGQAILKKVPVLRTIVNKTSSIESEFRTLPLQVIAGANELETSVRESGCTLKMNYAEVYWNSRLQAEHTRLVDSFAASDRICTLIFPYHADHHLSVGDMTAGIGPFAIPASKKGCHVWANDLNPASYKYLVSNAALNKVSHRVHAFNLDARVFVREMANQTPPRIFTRYIVNLPALSIEFLDVFPSLYPPGTFTPQNLPIVHCYCFTNAEDPRRDVIQRASERISHDLSHDPSVSVLEVRDVSPKKLFMCLSFKIPLSVLERPGGATNKRKPTDDVTVPAATGAISDSKKAKEEPKT